MGNSSGMIQQRRRERLYALLVEQNYTGLVLNAGPSLTYFTGLNFHLSERPVLLVVMQGSEPALVLPRLEAAKVSDLSGMSFFFYDEDPASWAYVFAQALRGCGGVDTVLAIEPLHLRFMEYSLLHPALPGASFVDGTSLLASLRSVKEPEERLAMEKAVTIAQDALQATLALIRVGMGEDELATELVLQLLRHGSEVELPFQPIVAAGPNGANPHATPSSRPLSPGDLLIIDWGASYGGYCSDLTRTFAVGDVGKEEARIHQVVLHANREGRKAGREGLKCGAVDEVVRRIIEEAGYGPFFTHRTGHGIGRQCHEEPYLRKGNEALLQCGMVYTVEPGVYLPSRNGVRIEDMVVVEERGPVTISSLPRDLIHVG